MQGKTETSANHAPLTSSFLSHYKTDRGQTPCPSGSGDGGDHGDGVHGDDGGGRGGPLYVGDARSHYNSHRSPGEWEMNAPNELWNRPKMYKVI